VVSSLVTRYETQKAQNRAVLEEYKTHLEELKTQAIEKKNAAKLTLDALKLLSVKRASLKTAYENAAANARASNNEALAAKYDALALKASTEEYDVKAQIQKAQAEYNAAKTEE